MATRLVVIAAFLAGFLHTPALRAEAPAVESVHAASTVPALTIPSVPSDWSRTEAEGIVFRVVPGADVRLAPALERLSDDIEGLKETFGTERPLLHGLEVRIVREPEDIARYAPVEAPPPAYASGVAYPSLRLVIVALKAPRSFEAVNVPEVLRHELIHVALHDASPAGRIPRWFDEGVALQLSGEHKQAREEILYRSASMGTLLPLQSLEQNFPDEGQEVDLAYAQSADFVRFLLRPADRARFATLMTRIEAGTPFHRALGDAYASDLRKLEYEWTRDVDARKGSPLAQAIATGSLLWGFGIVALALAWWKMRKRGKAIEARWEAEEHQLEQLRAALAAQAAREALLTEQWAASQTTNASEFTGNEADSPPPHGHRIVVVPVPQVRHEGGWHTLH
jgi:hypothetical protein